MIWLDLGLSAVWHTSGLLYSSVFHKGDERLFQMLLLPAVFSVSLNQSPLTPVCFGLNQSLHGYYFQTLRNHRLTQLLLGIINSNKAIIRTFRKVILTPQPLRYTFDCERKWFRSGWNKKEFSVSSFLSVNFRKNTKLWRSFNKLQVLGNTIFAKWFQICTAISLCRYGL